MIADHPGRAERHNYPNETRFRRRRARSAGVHWATRIVRPALLVVAIHVSVDSFVDLRGGVSPTGHLISGAIPLAMLGLMAATARHVRTGILAAASGLLGVAVLIGTGAAPIAGLTRGARGPGEVTAVAAAAAGLLLVATGATVAWLNRNREGSRRSRVVRRAGRGLAFGLATVFVAVPVGTAYVLANRSGPVHRVTDLGGPQENVTLQTADGLALQAAYVPSRNGAAVIVFPGVSGQGTGSRARILVDHGYGVLVLEPRGQSNSEGDPHLLGWTGEPDLVAAIDFLADRDDVEPGRIGGLGLSVGGELLIQTAAHDERLAAVVSEGAGTRWFAEDLHTPFPAWLVQVPFMAVATAATAVFSDTLPPPRLDHLVTEVAPRPLLLIWTPRGQGGEWFNPRYRDLAGPTAELWEIPESGHVGGLAARPQEYEERVIGFFDDAMAGAR